ncbi:MAG: pirin family protein [Acidimicrobiales bacterium]|nr:pirin family protein [Acidimicrobiales bacterium]
MPAVTVDDVTVLEKIPAPGPESRPRRVRTLTTAPSGFEGEGFPVHRAFAGVPLGALDPFVHMDQMGEVDYGPGEPKGTAWHPHRGFETVTYIIDGVFEHNDSAGGGGVITNGDTQWMTAGAGILHIERPPEALVQSGGLFHGIQLWVNLPSARKWVDPRYQDIGRDHVMLLSSPDGGALVRVIAGDVAGHPGPGVTHTPITMLHATLAPGARLELPWDPGSNALVYGLAGRGRVGGDMVSLDAGQLAVLGPGDTVVAESLTTQESRAPNLDLLILGGRPIGEPVAHYGPFVMNTREELAQAFEDFQKGRMGTIPAAHMKG